MVEQNCGRGPEAVVFTVGSHQLVAESLGQAVGTLGLGRGGLGLFSRGDVAEHFGTAGKKESCLRGSVPYGGRDIG